MNNNKIANLEKSIKLQKKIFGEDIFCNYAIYPPCLVIFIGVLGILYMLNIDKLISVYTIPFAIIFILGTLWLKFTKRFIVNRKIENSTCFSICLPIVFSTNGRKTIFLFSTGRNRNNLNYLEKEKRDLLSQGDIDLALSRIGNKPKQISDSDLFLVRQPIFGKLLGGKNSQDWIIYIGLNQSIKFISETEIKKYSSS